MLSDWKRVFRWVLYLLLVGKVVFGHMLYKYVGREVDLGIVERVKIAKVMSKVVIFA